MWVCTMFVDRRIYVWLDVDRQWHGFLGSAQCTSSNRTINGIFGSFVCYPVVVTTYNLYRYRVVPTMSIIIKHRKTYECQCVSTCFCVATNSEWRRQTNENPLESVCLFPGTDSPLLLSDLYWCERVAPLTIFMGNVFRHTCVDMFMLNEKG